MANCSACHKKADNGVFSKKTLETPTYGAWRDQRSFLGILEFKEFYRIQNFEILNSRIQKILEFQNPRDENEKSIYLAFCSQNFAFYYDYFIIWAYFSEGFVHAFFGSLFVLVMLGISVFLVVLGYLASEEGVGYFAFMLENYSSFAWIKDAHKMLANALLAIVCVYI